MSVFTPPTLLNSARWNNRRVGLLGGTFDPPHEGHLHISHAALKGLKLDCVWWLVTPQNPLKSTHPLPLEKRVELSRALVDHPQILVTDIEKDLGTRITYHTVKALKRHFPNTQFVWISGMDNAHSLHTWNRWQDLLGEICMLHIARKPTRSLAQRCPTRMLTRQKHVILDRPAALPLSAGTTYWMMQKKMVNISSTEIRKKCKEYQSLKERYAA